MQRNQGILQAKK